MLEKIGIMQGRLVPREIKSRIQSFPWTNWKKEIRLAKKYEIKYLEWTLDYKNFLSNPLIRKPLLVKKILKKNNIKLNSITADFFMQKPAWIKQKQKTNIFLIKLLNICNQLNIKFIVIPLVDNSSIKKGNKKKIINYFNSDKTISDKQEIKSGKEIRFILQLDSVWVYNKSFGINYDTGNSAFFGYNFNDEKHYFKRVLNIHIKDRKKGGQTKTLGKGDVDFKLFIKYLLRINYRNNLILQTYMPKNENKVTYETLKNLNFIKKIIHEK